MNITEIKLNNFLSYKEECIKLSENGIYTIYGTNKQTGSFNGVGKSTIKEAILYALFGKVRTKSVDDCIYFDETDMEVSLTFYLNTDKVIISRGRKRNKATTIKLIINDEDETKETTKETDIYIEQLLGIDYDKFMHSFCFGQSGFDDLKEMTSSRLIDFLISVLDISKLDSCESKIKDNLKKVDEKINLIEAKKDVYNEIEKDVDYKKLKRDSKKIIKNIEKLQEKYNKENKFLENITKERAELNNKCSILSSEINKLKNRIKFIKSNSQCPLCKTKLKGSSLLKTMKKEIDNKNTSLSYNNKLLKQKIEDEIGKKDIIRKINSKINHQNVKLYDIESKLESEDQVNNKINIDELEKEKDKFLKQKGILEKSKDVFSSKGLPLYILSNYIPKLEMIVNNILLEISDFSLSLKTEKKLKSTGELRNICEIELYKGDRKYPMYNLSNGEEFLITLSVRIGISKLYKTNKRIELLILDECFSALGKNNIAKVMRLINNLKSSFKKILVISHLDEIRDWQNTNKIILEKDNDVSTIKEIDYCE
jgi:DNA repair exonuclease SbcCD ATPase subunit